MSKKVLVVDDDVGHFKIIESLLKKHDCTIVHAEDGEKGLEKAKSERPDLILLDVIMPNLDGYGFITALRKTDEGKDTPVIVMTSNDELQPVFKLHNVNDYFLKPVKPNDVLEKILPHLQ